MSTLDGVVRLEHGSGGALSRQLVEELVHPHFRSDDYPELLDGTAVPLEGEAVLTTDTYVVDPPFFPGGDIGRLAVFGTCNDLAVSGAEPRYLTVGLVLEEGLPLAMLDRALCSLAAAAREAGVSVVTGDTKVVPSGKGGGIYINTAGLGKRVASFPLSPRRCSPGDAVIVSAPVGSHGLAVLAAREGLAVGSSIRSDCADLWPLCRSLLPFGEELRFIRDATRGGLAAVLNEVVSGAAVGMELVEADIPVAAEVRAVADILGLDPLEIANEGVLVAVLATRAAQAACQALQTQPAGRLAAVIGRITTARPGRVVLETEIGGRRILDFPRGLLLPRIC